MTILKVPLAIRAATVIGLLNCPSEGWANEARFRVTLSWVTNFVEPKPRSVRVQQSFIVTLHPNGRIEERSERRVGNGWPDARLTKREASLGEIGGKRAPVLWKVVDDKTLVRLLGRASHTFAIWVTAQDKDSCTARMEWRLKTGFSLYENRNGNDRVTGRFSEPSWPTARCDVL